MDVEIARYALDRVPLSIILDNSKLLLNLNYFFIRDRTPCRRRKPALARRACGSSRILYARVCRVVSPTRGPGQMQRRALSGGTGAYR